MFWTLEIPFKIGFTVYYTEFVIQGNEKDKYYSVDSLQNIHICTFRLAVSKRKPTFNSYASKLKKTPY
jgi:hypothetical protein